MVSIVLNDVRYGRKLTLVRRGRYPNLSVLPIFSCYPFQEQHQKARADDLNISVEAYKIALERQINESQRFMSHFATQLENISACRRKYLFCGKYCKTQVAQPLLWKGILVSESSFHDKSRLL